MNNLFSFKSITSRLTTYFLLVSLIPIFIITEIIYQQRVQSIKGEVFQKLTAIRDLKANQVRAWLIHRQADIKTISEDNEIRGIQEANIQNQSSVKAKSDIRKLLSRYLSNYPDYLEISIINPSTGIVEICTTPKHEGSNKSKDPYLKEALTHNDTFIKNIYFSKTLNAPSMTFSIPIYSPYSQQDIVGVLVARVDLKKSLYTLLSNRIGMGDTGETLIVNNSGLALNELRWHEQAPLNLTITSQPAKKASMGGSGIIESRDYRNVDVLASYTFIEAPQWGFVAKQDLSEVYWPIKKMLFQFLLLVGMAIIFVSALALYTSNKIARPIIKMAEAAKKITSGDLSANLQLKRTDELGILAIAFNNMASSISAQIEKIKQGEKLLREEKNSLEDTVEERTANLREEIADRKLIEKELSEAYTIIKRSPTVTFLWKNEAGWPVEFVSENIIQLTGYSSQDFLQKKILYEKIIHNDDLKRVTLEVARASCNNKQQSFKHEHYRLIAKNGDIKWIEDITYLRYDSQGVITHYEGVVTDISVRKEAEKKLQEYQDELEDRVEKRTYQLNQKTYKLENTNMALKVLLRETGTLKEEIEEKIQFNLKESVLPYLDEIKSIQKGHTLDFYIDTIKSNIDTITSSFTKSLSMAHQDLTPRELQIANCIRQGKTNKEIANLLSITSSAVDFHRRNLRIKLNIKGTKTNLRTRLLKYVG